MQNTPSENEPQAYTEEDLAEVQEAAHDMMGLLTHASGPTIALAASRALVAISEHALERGDLSVQGVLNIAASKIVAARIVEEILATANTPEALQ